MEGRTQFSATEIKISPITESDYQSLSTFYCGESEIDRFFHEEVSLCSKYKYLSPYKCTFSETGEIVGAFTLCNDILRLEYEDKVDFPNLSAEYDSIFQRQTTYPAINIGHLAIRQDCQSKGIGAIIVYFVQMTFARYRMSGCQFVTVDALNNPRAIRFYQDKVGFEFQTVSDLSNHTRRMYSDIFTHAMQ
ncbi:MAG: GNAT family N-acetyltransferase [Clostridium sp.]|nr:GNAT family N-acetyltransferase [Clostridium sp.]